MKKIYLEAVVLALIYLIVSLIIIDMNMSKGIVFQILLYPAKICLAPFREDKLMIEHINLGLFALYLLWLHCYVYLKMLKRAFKNKEDVSMNKS
tara:strand:- start:881 stop:1162 length:282 start_codon:yes stop_codon:yes gene_type:complete